MRKSPTFAKVVFSLIAVLAWAPTTARGAAYRLQLATEKADALYEKNSEVRFVVSVTKDKKPVCSGTVDYTLSEDGLDPFQKGSLSLGEQPAVISGRMEKPGFLQCHATFKPADGKPVQALAAAAVSPLEIQPSLPAPDDFDQFWADQKAALATIPMNPRLSPVEQANASVECFDVQLDCLGDAPVSGYFARPKDAKPKSLPALLWVHGAGVRSSILSNAIHGAAHGMLSMDINAHGIPNGRPHAFYDQLNQGCLKDYRYRGRESRQTCYFLGMYLRLVRAIDFLAAQSEWDGKIMVVCGHSQGGGQALVAGGLDDRVTLVATGVPAMCDHSGRAAGRINGWPKLVPTGPDGEPDARILEAARYFDAVNFARRCQADALMSVGFIDRTCPPTTNYAAYNQLPGKKKIINEPHMGHAAPKSITEAFFREIKEHARKGGQHR